MDRRSEGLLMAKNRRRTRKERTKQSRRMSFIVRHPADIPQWLLTGVM
jgi:hypothetical protein